MTPYLVADEIRRRGRDCVHLLSWAEHFKLLRQQLERALYREVMAHLRDHTRLRLWIIRSTRFLIRRPIRCPNPSSCYHRARPIRHYSLIVFRARSRAA
ncbi:hypothetical protein [Nonomuraea endophytica]|uniref:Uncharacterized protein n=1 Tax=Nonomuraea endophytica TaxID=714136 RepID=A0A7W7ZZS2_9ACTN|nr:hypothetical protein [Nonomuraea endophytica]MBB5076754.1 hypothetical protein [Nonomuraea endophytica]